MQALRNLAAILWLDDGRVLVPSTNNAAVDVAVERTDKDMGSGLLMRTGNGKLREQVPDRVTAALNPAAECDAD